MAQQCARFTRRAVANVSNNTPSQFLLPSASLRHFSSSPNFQKAPSLADIESGNGPAFDARQQEFRERLAQQKAQQDSQSPRHAASAAASAAEVASATRRSVEEALNSPTFSGEAREAARTASDPDGSSSENGKKQGRLSRLIHGTEEGRLHEKELERSFSQVLARGKYVHSITFHEVKYDKIDEYTELVGNFYPRAAADPSNHLKLVGSWRTEVGDCNTFGRLKMRSSIHFTRL